MNRSLVGFEYKKSPLHTIVYGRTGTSKTYFIRQYLKLYLDPRTDSVCGKPSGYTAQNQNQNQDQDLRSSKPRTKFVHGSAKQFGKPQTKFVHRSS